MKKEFVAETIKKALENRTTQFLDITMKADGQSVTLDSVRYGYEGKIKYTAWFSKNGQLAETYDINELAQWLIEYPKKADELEDEEDDWVATELPKLKQYFKTWFFGKSWDTIKNDAELYERWGEYSDWHKDVFGYRPHAVVCGEYVKPY